MPTREIMTKGQSFDSMGLVDIERTEFCFFWKAGQA